MVGKLKLEDKIWYVVYEDLVRVFPFHQYTTREIPVKPQSLVNQKCVPGKEVEFDIITIDNGDNGIRYAKLKIPELKYKDGTPIRSYYNKKLQKMMDEINSEENPEEKINELKNKTITITYDDPIDYSKSKKKFDELNYPLNYKIIRDCEFCGEKVKEEFQPVCDDCREALKDLVLERKKYNNKYKTGDNK